ADAQHGAIAPHHQAEVAARADLLDRERLVAPHIGLLGLRLLHEDLAPARLEKRRDAAHDPVKRARPCPGASGLVFADECDAAETGSHAANYITKMRRCWTTAPSCCSRLWWSATSLMDSRSVRAR